MTVRLHNIIFNSVLAILLSALFVSCKDKEEEENTNKSQSKGGVIGFNAFQDGFQKPATRAVIDNIGQLNEIYVLSMKKKDSGNWEQVFKNDAGTAIDVLTLNRGSVTGQGEIWDYSPVENWEDNTYYKFRAFYPNKGGFNTTAGETCANGFEYTKPSTDFTLNNYKSANDPRKNTDLLVSKEVTRAYTTAEGNDEPVPLKMNHILSCVSFSIKKKEGTKLTITSFKLKNYASKGTYDVSDWQFEKKNYNSSTDLNNDFNFYDLKGNKFEVGNGDLNGNGNGSNKLKDKDFYVEYKADGQNAILSSYSAELTEGLVNDIESSVTEKSNYCTGLLMIPQVLKGQNDVIKITLKTGTVITGEIHNNVEAEIKFKFDNGPELTAIVDLTANGKVPEWEPGVKYNYTIGIYEYQATANITIEDWVHHTYEEELK